MTLIPSVLRRSGFPDGQVDQLRRSLQGFLDSADLAESALIIDGSGPGVASHFIALSLLGAQRVQQFRRVHAVSASSFGLLYFFARHRGMLTLTRMAMDDFDRANRARHGVTGLGSGSRLLLRKLSGLPYLFPNDRAEDILAYGVPPDFLQMRVSNLPENVCFWTYCLEDRELCEIRHDSRFADWSLREVIRAVTAVKGIYAPFPKAGRTYVDAVTTPTLRQRYRDLRRQFPQVLFLHMNRHGVDGNTTFVKMHHSGPGRVRIILDFLYLMSGIPNREIGEAIRLGLEVEPIREGVSSAAVGPRQQIDRSR